MPRLRGWQWLVIALAVALGAAAGWTLWWSQRTPPVVRALPAGETLAYINVATLRRAGLAQSGGTAAAEVASPGEYTSFVQASGFDFERDLDALAVSLQGDPDAPDSATAVGTGRFAPQLDGWLVAHATHKLDLPSGTAYQFPGWARPQQTLTIAHLDAGRMLLTNARDPAAVIAATRRGGTSSPLWQTARWQAPPVVFVGVDTEQLAADRWLDASGGPPWRGMQRLRFALRPTLAAGAVVTATAAMQDAASAAAAQTWAQQTLAALQAAAMPEAGGINWSATLHGVTVSSKGSTLTVTCGLDAATLRGLQDAVVSPPHR